MPPKSKNEKINFDFHESIMMRVFYDDVAWISGKRLMRQIFDK